MCVEKSMSNKECILFSLYYLLKRTHTKTTFLFLIPISHFSLLLYILLTADNIISQTYIIHIASQSIILGWDAIKRIRVNKKSFAELSYPI